jgi:hypothetical protein
MAHRQAVQDEKPGYQYAKNNKYLIPKTLETLLYALDDVQVLSIYYEKGEKEEKIPDS